jgi:flagellar biosynthesis protein FlhF
MRVVRFISETAASALARIHDQLGPEAVVLSVRRLPVPGMARLWQRNGPMEILAGVPDKTSSPPAEEWPALGESWKDAPTEFTAGPAAAGVASSPDRWPSVAWLEAMGLLPPQADRLQNFLATQHPAAPASLDAEWTAVSAALEGFWSAAPPLPAGPAPQTHVFIGPPGSGKSTVLCKWLTLAVLTQQRSARVWRLDNDTANTAEFLTVHCEMLGAPVERFWSEPKAHADLHFIDFPGTETDDPRAWAALRRQLASLPSPQVHLVLNAAYETDALLAQWRMFAAFKPADLIVTHLDEEMRRVKLWNLVLGTNCTMRFLSAGQKIPGEFQAAAPHLLFPSQISR